MLLWVHRVRITCIPHLRLTEHVAEAEQASKTASPAKRRKKDLTESEIALRRAETARKRKDLSEKKLEDEKVGPASLPPFVYARADRRVS